VANCGGNSWQFGGLHGGIVWGSVIDFSLWSVVEAPRMVGDVI